MFNPTGMAMGLLVAKQKGVKDPLLPAIVGGMLPFPLGPVAALLLAREPEPAPAPVVAAAPQAQPPDKDAVAKELQDATEALRQAKTKAAITAARERLIRAKAAADALQATVRDRVLGDLIAQAQQVLIDVVAA